MAAMLVFMAACTMFPMTVLRIAKPLCVVTDVFGDVVVTVDSVGLAELGDVIPGLPVALAW
jgi:hypothetical protein